MSMIPHFTRQRSKKSHTNWFENKGNLLAAPTNSLTSNAAAYEYKLLATKFYYVMSFDRMLSLQLR